MTERDAIDTTLLRLLAEDGRAPLKALAEAVGLSVSAVQSRVARLRRDGMIRKFTIERPPAEAGCAAYLWVTAETPMCERLAPLLAEIPEIALCDSIGGEVDLSLYVECATPARLQQIRERIAAMEEVRSVRTAPVMKRMFDRRT